MKNRHLSSALLTILVVSALLVPKQTSAFWFFDLFRGGQVKGESVSSSSSSSSGTGQITTSALLKTQDTNPAISESKIKELVASGKLTTEQGKVLLAKIRAIKVKKDELTALEKALRAWIVANRINTQIFQTNATTTTTDNR